MVVVVVAVVASWKACTSGDECVWWWYWWRWWRVGGARASCLDRKFLPQPLGLLVHPCKASAAQKTIQRHQPSPSHIHARVHTRTRYYHHLYPTRIFTLPTATTITTITTTTMTDSQSPGNIFSTPLILSHRRWQQWSGRAMGKVSGTHGPSAI